MFTVDSDCIYGKPHLKPKMNYGFYILNAELLIFSVYTGIILPQMSTLKMCTT